MALVGGSGSGKSTMAKLLLKYYEPEAGEILVDGVSLTEFTNQSVRQGISCVPQNIELFSKSIFENIRMGKPNATLEEVKEAAKEADAHEFIKRLPLQYHTWLEEAGNGLSGGEKQRLVLARAFIKNDEIWFVERQEDHSSSIFSLNKFRERFDKRIDKEYLLGRYGAIPVFDDDFGRWGDVNE